MRLFAARLLLAALLVGCQSGAKLEPGGAYAPTNTPGGVPPGAAPGGGTGGTPQGDYGFFVADASYQLAYSAIDAVFQFELDNRTNLFRLAPGIKHELDKIRPDALQVNNNYLAARDAYMAHPTPAGLNGLQTIVKKLEQLGAAAKALLPKQK